MGTIIKVPMSTINNRGLDAEYSFVFTGDPTWKERAKCRGKSELVDVLFFPKVRGKAEKLFKQIEEVCGDCPVKMDCYKFGVESGAVEGVWGGVWFRRNRPKKKE